MTRRIDAIDEEEARLAAEVERLVRAQRGRWMVVEESGCAYRYSRKSAARSLVARLAQAGMRARLLRYRRDRVTYVGGGFEVSDPRWLPRRRGGHVYEYAGDICIADDINECQCASCLDDEEQWERDQGWRDDDDDDGEGDRDWCTSRAGSPRSRWTVPVVRQGAWSAMRELPIIMQDESVLGILDGTKLQSRRAMKPQPAHVQRHEWRGKLVYEGEHRLWCWRGHTYENLWDFGEHNEDRKRLAKLSPYGAPGDRLWCKEAWQTGISLDDKTPSEIGQAAVDAGYTKPWAPLNFVAGGYKRNADELRNFGNQWGRVRNPLHLPRWASRITLELAEVRVQLLQEISEDDARAEGVRVSDAATAKQDTVDTHGMSPHRAAFACLWDSINIDRAPWASNPWVWTLTFRRVP